MNSPDKESPFLSFTWILPKFHLDQGGQPPWDPIHLHADCFAVSGTTGESCTKTVGTAGWTRMVLTGSSSSSRHSWYGLGQKHFLTIALSALLKCLTQYQPQASESGDPDGSAGSAPAKPGAGWIRGLTMESTHSTRQRELQLGGCVCLTERGRLPFQQGAAAGWNEGARASHSWCSDTDPFINQTASLPPSQHGLWHPHFSMLLTCTANPRSWC